MDLKMFSFLKVLLPDTERSEEGAPPGRKFLMGRYTLLLATMGFLATALATPLSANFGVFVGALATLFTIYCGGNVWNKQVQKPVASTQVILDRRKNGPIEEDKLADGPGPAGG